MTFCVSTRALKRLIASAALIASITACSAGSDDPMTDASKAFEAHEYSTARIHILGALQENSTDAAANFLFGQILIKLGDGAGAVAAFEKIVDDASYAKRVRPLLAHAYLLNDAPEKALQLVRDDTTNAKSIWVKSGAYLSLGQVESARAALDAGLAKFPDDSDLIVLDGKYNLTLGNMAEARRAAARALKISPNDLEALQLSGRLAMMQQDSAKAQKLFEKAAETYPDAIVPLFSLAAIHADLGDEAKSRAYFKQILSRAPKHPLALFMLADLEFEKGNVDEAHQKLQLAGNNISDMPEAILLGGEIALARGNTEQAINKLQRFLGMVPGDAQGIAALRKALTAAGDVTAAAALPKPSARAAIAEDMKKADAAIKAGNWKAADAIYAKLRVSANGADPVLLNNSALVALELGDLAAAEKHARAAYAKAPDDAFVQDTLGWVLFKKGNGKQALALIKSAAAKAPDNAEIAAHLKEVESF